MNEKQQQLLFDKGITNAPSDILCSDNALEECIGLTYDNGEHKVIQKPVSKMTGAPTILYIHKIGTQENYIALDGTTIKWASPSGTVWPSGASTLITGVTDAQVTSIGRTLVVNSSSGLVYCLWSGSGYEVLGDFPDVRMGFSLTSMSAHIYGNQKHVDLTELLDGMNLKALGNDFITGSFFKNDKYEDAKAGLIGLVSMRLNEIKEQGRFAFPFWVRYAIRLYDGSYVNISNPILMLPTIRNNWNIFTCDDDGNRKVMHNIGAWPQTNYTPIHFELFCQVEQIDLTEWQDVISGIDIFLSEEVKSFDMEGRWTIENCLVAPTGSDTAIPNPLFDGNTPLSDFCNPLARAYQKIPAYSDADSSTHYTFFRPKQLSDGDIIKQLIDSSVFYRAIELNFSDINNQTSGFTASTKMYNKLLLNLKTQTQLPYDDYFSRASIKANIIKSYNSRLHLADVKRGFFDGFTNFSYTAYEEAAVERSWYVYIKTDSGVQIRMASATTREIIDTWFYYPDPRAFKVDVYYTFNGALRCVSLSLTEHPSLNGAYAFISLPTYNAATPLTAGSSVPTVTTEDEDLSEHLLVSEVNNPWLFNASGDHTIRMGGIVGLASQTMALNELEHGIHPLTVFSKKGISLMRLKDDGTYLRSDEISREVCNKEKSITETDGPVFFSSDKGLMVVVGQKVECVSEQLSGRSSSPFASYLKEAFIAYDYRDSLLWIFDGTSTTCWIYSIKSGTFSHYTFDYAITNVVNDYPDYLLQTGEGIVYSLIERPNINLDIINGQLRQYSAQIVTRPLKLENGMALKTIMQMLHVKYFNDDASLALTIQASDDITNWVTLSSLRGKPWKYYRFTYNFTNLIATDRFAGTMLVTQERRTNKLR